MAKGLLDLFDELSIDKLRFDCMNEKTFAEFGSLMSEKNQDVVKEALQSARKAIESEDLGQLKQTLTELQVASKLLTDVILSEPDAAE